MPSGLANAHQRAELLGRQRAIGRADLRVLLEGELILHVVGQEVHLQRRRPDDCLELERVERGARAASHVVLKARQRSEGQSLIARHGKASPRRLARMKLRKGLSGIECAGRRSARATISSAAIRSRYVSSLLPGHDSAGGNAPPRTRDSRNPEVAASTRTSSVPAIRPA